MKDKQKPIIGIDFGNKSDFTAFVKYQVKDGLLIIEKVVVRESSQQ